MTTQANPETSAVGNGLRPILVAVDGTNLLHRTHHAHSASDRRDARGAPVWALYGMARLLSSAVAKITSSWRPPTGLVVCFDGPRELCRRRGMDSLYKATRRAPDPGLEAQLASAPQWMTDTGLSVMTIDGYEADDGCASAATAANKIGWRCIIVTSDRDAFAHASASTRVLRPVNGGGWDALGQAEIAAKYGLPTKGYKGTFGFPAYSAYAALRGDKSDELAGVAGIGEKTAAAIISALAAVERTVEDVLTGDEIAACALRDRHRALLEAGAANYHRNRRMMDAVVDLPVDFAAASDPLDVARVHSACQTHGVGDASETLSSVLPHYQTMAPI